MDRGSNDWDRLADEGFQMLEYGSNSHYIALLNAEILASSHADENIVWPIGRPAVKFAAHFKFVFLQHGVTKDDLSDWLQNKPISLMITSTMAEYDSISEPDTNYLLSEKNTALTGFPRHDSLLEQPKTKHTILIMPTWRSNLRGDTMKGRPSAEDIANFVQSDYAREWMALLSSAKLIDLAVKSGKGIVFCPHPHMYDFVNALDIPAYVRILQPHDSLQNEFAAAAVLITDYSSVAFDLAYIDCPVVYYQFDREDFYFSNPAIRMGYFEYERDGFGPICLEFDVAMEAIGTALDGDENPCYNKRRKNTFTHRDGRCCERVLEEIHKITQRT